MSQQDAPKVWDSEQYWLKARGYVSRAQEYGSDSPDYALWYAFALEHLARAALCSFHPVLNADPQHVESLFYGVGVIRTERPKSIPIHAVFGRLVQLLDDFTSSHSAFCGEMANRRNSELHSAELAFENVRTQSWLARYYEVCEVLCAALGHSLNDFFGKEEAEAARTLIAASKSGNLGKVKARLAKHKAAFDKMSPKFRTTFQTLSTITARLSPAAAVQCPACNSDGRLEGNKLREGAPHYSDGELTVEATFLSSSFKCSVCNLELHGEEEILFAGLPPTFTETEFTSLHEMFEPEYEDEYMNM